MDDGVEMDVLETEEETIVEDGGDGGDREGPALRANAQFNTFTSAPNEEGETGSTSSEPNSPSTTSRHRFQKSLSVKENAISVAERMRRNPTLHLVSKNLNDEEKELFIVVREGDTQRAIEILNNPVVRNN